jgi:acetyl-CoA C-acetyltransferase
MLNAYIFAGLRTPFGRHAGALARWRPCGPMILRPM